MSIEARIVAPPDSELIDMLEQLRDRMSRELILLKRMVRAHPGPHTLLGLFDPAPRGEILALSRGWEKVLGFPADELEGTPWEDMLVSEEQARRVYQAVETQALSGFRSFWRCRTNPGKVAMAVHLEWESTAMKAGGINLATAWPLGFHRLGDGPGRRGEVRRPGHEASDDVGDPAA